MLISEQFPTLLVPTIYHHLDIGMRNVPSMRSALFNVQGSNLAQENGVGLGGVATEMWDQYEASGTKGRMDFDELFTQTYTHVEYPVEVVIRKKLLINDQYGQIQKHIQKLGMSDETKMEKDAAKLFNLAFTGATWSDGVALCSDSHPVKPGSSDTFDNNGTLALTHDNVSAVRVLMMRFADDKGEEIGIVPDELWVPPELEDTALEIVGSMQRSDNANNATNTQAGRWTVHPWLRLTDTNAWFTSSSAHRKMAVNWYVREAMQAMLTHETTTEFVYEVKLHYSYGVDDWRWVYGNNPS